jgi:hypothetical protein
MLNSEKTDLHNLLDLAEGGAAILRPDSHLSAIVERPTIQTLRDAVLHALGRTLTVPSLAVAE